MFLSFGQAINLQWMSRPCEAGHDGVASNDNWVINGFSQSTRQAHSHPTGTVSKEPKRPAQSF